MKKLFIIITTIMVISSCVTTKEAKLSRAELRNEKKLANQEEVRNAVESKKFIIKLDRLYFSYGGIADLLPRYNYIIIDGEKAIINTAYFGRQYDIRRIAAIDIFGRNVNYEVTKDFSKGVYRVKMKVRNAGSNTFDVYLDISKNGYCNASVSSIKIDYIRYSGFVEPIKVETNTTPPAGDVI
ncbi:MAG TPA: DUF4251 domain-containing protein [Bacteroidales bacterium]